MTRAENDARKGDRTMNFKESNRKALEWRS